MSAVEGSEATGNAEGERHVAAVSAALTLLDAFDADIPLRLRDLHLRTGLQKSRILRLAGTLVAAGYLTLDDAGFYRLGPRISALGQIVAQGSLIVASRIRPVLEALCGELGDTTFFSVVQGMQRLAVDKVSPANGLLFSVSRGQLRPLYIGATGRILLAFGPDLLVEQVIATTREIDPTIEADLRMDLSRARSEGYLLSVGRLTAHAFALSVPVLGPARELLGALTIAGPESKISPAEAPSLAVRMRAAVREAGFQSSAISDAGARKILMESLP